jgi:hypothetical protein
VGYLCHLQPLLFLVSLFFFFAVQESLVSEEIVHDLDTCEVTVEGDELNAEQESLEVDVTRLQQKGIEASHSDLGVVFTGEGKASACPLPTNAHWCIRLTLAPFCTWRGHGQCFVQGGAGHITNSSCPRMEKCLLALL